MLKGYRGTSDRDLANQTYGNLFLSYDPALLAGDRKMYES